MLECLRISVIIIVPFILLTQSISGINAEINKPTNSQLLPRLEGYIKLNTNLKNVTAFVGKKASFLCDISGKPVPQISWKKGLLPLTDINLKIKIRQKLWGSVLKIEDLDFSDEGFYVCHAENLHGAINTSAYLKVIKQQTSSKKLPNEAEDEDQNANEESDGKGFCQTFQSSTCGKYLSGHMVFVTHGFVQSKKERRIASLVAEISSVLSEQADQECLKHIMRLICHDNFLICGDDNRPRRLCQEDCKDVTKKRCNYTYKLMLTKLKKNYLLSVPKCDTLNNNPSCFKFNDIPSPSIKQRVQTNKIDCINGSSNYDGSVSQTVDGVTCIFWKSVPGYEHMPPSDANYCRNAKLENVPQPNSPWCFTSLSNSWNVCPVRQCIDSSQSSITKSSNFFPVYISISCVIGFVIIIICICWICKKTKYGIYSNSNGIGRKSYLGLYKPCQNDFKKSENSSVQLNKLKISSIEYPLSQIRFQEQIGEGIFGAVYKAELKNLNNNPPSNSNNNIVIVKTLSAGSSTSLQRDFKHEAQMMSELKHVNVLALIGVSMRQIPWCLIFDYMEKRDLHEHLLNSTSLEARSMSTVPADSMDAYGDVSLSYTDQIFIAAQIASGMEYLSSRTFVHRDLAARNILIGENLMCKISDIGLVKDCYSSDYYRTTGSTLMLPIRWMSPEAILYGRFTVESDVWAYGVLLWEIWSNGLQPFYGHSNTEVMDLVNSRQILPCPENCPTKVYDLMLECWNEMPRYRPQFKNIHSRIRVWQQEVVEINQNCVGAGSARSVSQSGGSKHTTSSTEMCSDHSHLLNGYSPVTCQSNQDPSSNCIINNINFNQQFEPQPLVSQSGPMHFSRLPNTNTIYLPELSHIV